MATAALKDEALQPQAPGGLPQGAALALLAHAGLLVVLSLGLQWRTQTPEPISAELWAALPEVAAPPAAVAPVAPAPQPTPAPKLQAPLPNPQIAIERDKKKRQTEHEEQLAREEQKKQVLRDQQATEARLAQQREANLKRMMGQMGASGSTSANSSATGAANQDAGPSKSYAGKLVAQIKPNIVFTDSVPGNAAAEVEVRAAPSGTIVSRRLVKSSGHKEWDDAVLRAIDRTGSLPRDIDGRVPATIIVAFRPQE